MGMNEDIALYGVYGLTHRGELVRVPIFSTDDYNHYTHHLHHYIKQQDFKKNKTWFNERGIKQKLILLPVWVHLIIHDNPDGARLTDKQFYERFKTHKWELLFNRKKWCEGNYGKI